VEEEEGQGAKRVVLGGVRQFEHVELPAVGAGELPLDLGDGEGRQGPVQNVANAIGKAEEVGVKMAPEIRTRYL
jgi:hypothetical protein